MQNLDKLYIFTNSRKIREFNAKFQNELVPKAMTIAQFEQKAVLVPGCFEADEAYALVLMQRACASVREASERLRIPSEFFAFLKNNDYLFSFFKELAISKKSVADLKFSDIYADYEEHLGILEAVLARYKELLAAENLYDGIALPEIYRLNGGFVREFREIYLEVDGFLSEFEWELFSEIAKLTTLKIIFQTSKFNKKLISKLAEISGIEASEFSLYCEFELNLSSRELKKTGVLRKNPLVLKRSFSARSLQAAYAMAKASEFVAEGIKPENIAVILPDESFAEILRLHDRSKMFNFAMGESFTRTRFFQILKCIVTAVNDKIRVNLSEDNYKNFNEFEFNLHEFGVSGELFAKFKNGFEAPCSFEDFRALMEEILALESDPAAAQKAREELFYAQSLARYFSFTLRQICEIFLIKLARLRLDHVGGGKIGVMGVLESRGLKFDGVIVLDFNDDLVPKRSVNETFLSSRVRQKAGLIGYVDRENLQRFYYESLIGGAKKAAICYAANEEKIASRFLGEFNVVEDARFSDESYAALFNGEFADEQKLEAETNPHLDERNEAKSGQTKTAKERSLFEFDVQGELDSGANLAIKSDENGAQNKTPSENPRALNLIKFTRKTPAKPKIFEQDIIVKHDFFAIPLSFSRLNTYLQCPRRYYYRYILNVNPPVMPQTASAADFGNSLHRALFEYYSKFERFDLAKFETVLRELNTPPLEREITMIKMEKFKAVEDARYEAGWRVHGLEKELDSVFAGVRITGKIDRIDVCGGELAVIDYKSGKFDAKSLQLPFYEALVGKPCEGYFYDLKDTMGLVASEASTEALGEAIEQLKSINDTPINFGEAKGAMSEYEDYKILVKGEL
nr:PD-(D/E)XK nuclease family protein [uncultured Campylobacter sp.]